MAFSLCDTYNLFGAIPPFPPMPPVPFLFPQPFVPQLTSNTETTMSIFVFVSIPLWIIFSLLLMSLIEYAAHRWPMHNKRFVRTTGLGEDAIESHAVLHHGRFYKNFEGDPDPAAKFVSIDLPAGYMFVGLSPLWLAIGLYSLTGAVCFALTILAHGFIWTTIHREMHEPRNRWFSSWSLYKFWRAYHKMHHERPATNYNVVIPFWDFVFGTYGGLSK